MRSPEKGCLFIHSFSCIEVALVCHAFMRILQHMKHRPCFPKVEYYRLNPIDLINRQSLNPSFIHWPNIAVSGLGLRTDVANRRKMTCSPEPTVYGRVSMKVDPEWWGKKEKGGIEFRLGERLEHIGVSKGKGYCGWVSERMEINLQMCVSKTDSHLSVH